MENASKMIMIIGLVSYTFNISTVLLMISTVPYLLAANKNNQTKKNVILCLSLLYTYLKQKVKEHKVYEKIEEYTKRIGHEVKLSGCIKKIE
jgi:hypothetical protein